MTSVLTPTACSPSPQALSLLRRIASLLSGVSRVHLIGGFVRDALLGHPGRDIDIALEGDALSVARRLAQATGGSYVPLDPSSGIARVIIPHEGVLWQVDIAALQGDPLQDLARRDFTIDAMGVPLSSFLESAWQESLLDPFHGRADLERRTVRAVTRNAFREDGARLLRAVRLAATLGFSVEAKTRAWIRQDAPALEGVSRERVRDEFLALLSCSSLLRHLQALDDLGLLTRILPELEEGRGVGQPPEHYWDVLHHNLQAAGAVEGILERTRVPPWILEETPWDPPLETYFQEPASDGHSRATLTRLAALLHDVAKPAARTVEPSGRIRFLGHHTQGARMARHALERLRLSRKGVALVETMVELHLRPTQMAQGEDMPTHRAIYRFSRHGGEAALAALYLNMADYLAARGPFLQREQWQAHTHLIGHILEVMRHQEVTTITPPLVTGHDVMEHLGLEPGPLVGRVLEAIREAQAAGEVASHQEALALAQAHLKKEPPRASLR